MNNEDEKLKAQGLKEITVSILRMNLIALGVILPVFAFLFFYFRWHWESFILKLQSFSSIKIVGYVVLFFVLYLIAIVLHELIHGVFFARYAKNGFRSVKFGVMWQFLAPYCHCKEPIQANHYRITLLMPTILLGFLPLLIGILLGNYILILLACLMILGGSGDFALWWIVRKLPSKTVVYDHPSKIGFFYEDNN